MDALRVHDPAQLGPYWLLGRLGAGGMGQVYLGRTSDGRLAAVKAVHAGFAGDPEFRARFAREIRTASQVRAPWTASVLGADPAAARPWLATEYVPGPSLEQAVAAAGALPEAAVGVLAGRLADALAALHSTGVVHRDLKPSNVLLAGDGPRLVDFGIARAADAELLTGAGAVLGTPAYLAPEQALGEPAGSAADVFSLASLLVFAATGSGPFGVTGNSAAMLYRVSHRDPDLSGVPGWLGQRLAPCLDRDPAARPTARLLAAGFAELDWPRDAWPPVPAAAPAGFGRPVEGPTRLVAPALRSAGGAGASGRPTRLIARSVRLAGPTRTRPRRAVAQVAVLVGLVLLLGMSTGLAQLVPGGSSRPVPVAVTPTGAATGAAESFEAAREATPLPFGKGTGGSADPADTSNSAVAVTVSPDSSRAYVPTSQGVSVVDTGTGRVSVRIVMPGGCQSVAVSPDGKRLYVSALAGFLYVIDTENNRLLGTVALPSGTEGVVLGARGRYAYVLNPRRNAVFVVDTQTNGVVGSFAVGTSPGAIAASQDGRRVLVAAREAVSVIDTAGNTVVSTKPIGSVRDITITPDGARAYLIGLDSTQVLDLNTGESRGAITMPSGVFPSHAALSAGGRYLLAAVHGFGGASSTVVVIDTVDSAEVGRIPVSGEPDGITAAPDGRRLYLVGSYGAPVMVVALR